MEVRFLANVNSDTFIIRGEKGEKAIWQILRVYEKVYSNSPLSLSGIQKGRLGEGWLNPFDLGALMLFIHQMFSLSAVINFLLLCDISGLSVKLILLSCYKLVSV